jgi:hypothetical protein
VSGLGWDQLGWVGWWDTQWGPRLVIMIPYAWFLWASAETWLPLSFYCSWIAMKQLSVTWRILSHLHQELRYGRLCAACGEKESRRQKVVGKQNAEKMFIRKKEKLVQSVKRGITIKVAVWQISPSCVCYLQAVQKYSNFNDFTGWFIKRTYEILFLYVYMCVCTNIYTKLIQSI